MSRQPARPRPGEPITLATTSTGQVRYRTVLDHAPPGEPRQQRRATFATLTAARAHVAEVKARREAGSLPTRDRDTFDRFADEYLEERAGRVRANTYDSYVVALRRPRAAFGDVPLGRLTTGDVERLVAAMAGEGLSQRWVGLILQQTRAVLQRAVRQGAAVRNVADGVQARGKPAQRRGTLTPAQVAAVAAAARQDRLAAAWALTLCGLRPSEVLGLRWLDLTLTGDSPTLTVEHGRTGASTDLTPPKTKRSARTLPLPADAVAQLRAWRSALASDLGLLAVAAEAFVVVDEAGRPLRPDQYADAWRALCLAAGVGRHVLYVARHSSVTHMRAAGVPDRIVAAWHGHDETVMRAVYDHADSDREALVAAAEVLAAVQRAAGSP